MKCTNDGILEELFNMTFSEWIQNKIINKLNGRKRKRKKADWRAEHLLKIHSPELRNFGAIEITIDDLQFGKYRHREWDGEGEKERKTERRKGRDRNGEKERKIKSKKRDKRREKKLSEKWRKRKQVVKCSNTISITAFCSF